MEATFDVSMKPPPQRANSPDRLSDAIARLIILPKLPLAEVQTARRRSAFVGHRNHQATPQRRSAASIGNASTSARLDLQRLFAGD
jgi:hypothetical protein